MMTPHEPYIENSAPIDATNIYDLMADSLISQGYAVCTDILPTSMTQSLYQRVTQLGSSEFSAAGIGRKQEYQLNQQIRSDITRWLSTEHPVDAAYLNWMTGLRTELNQRLYMGLFKYEAHYAHYAPGAFYQRHVDAFTGQSNRVLTSLLYLNPDWKADDGGELLIYDPETEEVIEQILPEYGKFIVFLSTQFPHQVLKAKRDRFSISGWFHINSSP